MIEVAFLIICGHLLSVHDFNVKKLFHSTRGIIEFDRKSSATRAIEQVNNGCFFLTKSPRAIVAAQIEAEDADDGLREVNYV